MADVGPPPPPWQCTRGEFVEDHGNGPVRYTWIAQRDEGYRTIYVYKTIYVQSFTGKTWYADKDCTFD